MLVKFSYGVYVLRISNVTKTCQNKNSCHSQLDKEFINIDKVMI